MREREEKKTKYFAPLDDSYETLHRKEKEFEDTMDHLQNDLTSLENERGELKNKLKETTMKVLLEGIASKQNVSMSGQGGAGPMSFGPSVPAPVKDSPMLMRQLQDTQLALTSVREESYRSVSIFFFFYNFCILSVCVMTSGVLHFRKIS